MIRNGIKRSEITTEEDLREYIGIGEKDLIGSKSGAIDIFGVKNGMVSLGYVATGWQDKRTIDDFLKDGKM